MSLLKKIFLKNFQPWRRNVLHRIEIWLDKGGMVHVDQYGPFETQGDEWKAVLTRVSEIYEYKIGTCPGCGCLVPETRIK